MKNLFIFLFFGLSIFQVQSQITKPDTSNGVYRADSTQFKKSVEVEIDGETHFTDYKLISIKNDTTVVDTILNIENEYKFNFLRKDKFESMAFANQGQTYNKLAYEFNDNSLFPTIGFDAKQTYYYTLNDIYYFSVPTPTTELMYRKGMKQGQVLDAFITANTSRQLNFSAAYKGLRSLGTYQNVLASHGNFRFTFNYNTKRKGYYLRGHFYSYDFHNDQNGGLTDRSIGYFESGDKEYTNRARLDVNFTDGNNLFEGKRYYLDQTIVLFSNYLPEKVKKIKIKKPSKALDSLQEALNLAKLDSIQTVNLDSLQRTIPLIKSDSIQNLEVVVKNDSLKAPEINKAAIVKDTIADEIVITRSDSLPKTTKPLNRPVRDKPQIELDSLGKPFKLVANDSIAIDTIAQKAFFDIKLGNSLMYETKHYRYTQTSANSFFGDAFTSEIQDHTSMQQFIGQLYLQMNSKYVGSLKIKANYFDYNYHYNSILYYDDYTVGDKLKGSALSVGADWNKKFGRVFLNADAQTIISGDLTGSSLKGAVKYQHKDLFNFQGYVEFASKSPEFNKQLFQSDYIDYNWQNKFENEDITSIGASFNSDKWVTLKASYNIIDNYTYFDSISKPSQSSETVSYYKIKLVKTFTYRKFSLANTVLYQNTLEEQDFFRIPNWITRNTLFFSTDLFKGDPLFLQTGITFKYFTSFKMNAYNPLISEFHIQNDDLIGDFPMLDFFLNLRIQRTRIYLKLENFSAGFTGRNYYSAPTYPYRDLTFRIGLVWNFFI